MAEANHHPAPRPPELHPSTPSSPHPSPGSLRSSGMYLGYRDDPNSLRGNTGTPRGGTKALPYLRP